MENPYKKNLDQTVFSSKSSPAFNPDSQTCESLKLKDVTCKAPGSETKSELLEMSPTPYSDLGKRARDLFSKGYHFGLIKLDCRTTTASGVHFHSGGQSEQESGKVSGSFESKYTIKDYGISFTEKWTTDNTLGTEVTVTDQGLKGLKVTAGVNFSPQEGIKSGVAKLAYANEKFAANADADLKGDGQLVKASAVVGHQGWLTGYQGTFDVQNTKLAKSNFSLGFSTKDFVLHTEVNDGQLFSGAIYQQVNPKMETGVNLSWATSGEKTVFGLACKYDLDQDASLRAKINNSSQIGLGYQQRLRDGVTLTLSTLIDGRNFNQGGHKIGLALELEA
ncbi:unnamed protein product [Phyllotreta striolata]|uniref:Voltage-dependent anion-selective channel protein 3 n=1 Tax=Phyllotreta striolata TaxID=444603 RepID=A0A9P0DLD1_PHYSR|nr:unnamed protein product [Phyllotreta striolata]